MINIIIKPNNNNKPKKINYTIENNIFLNIKIKIIIIMKN